MKDAKSQSASRWGKGSSSDKTRNKKMKGRPVAIGDHDYYAPSSPTAKGHPPKSAKWRRISVGAKEGEVRSGTGAVAFFHHGCKERKLWAARMVA